MSVIYQYGIGGNTLQSYKVKGKTMFENELVAKTGQPHTEYDLSINDNRNIYTLPLKYWQAGKFKTRLCWPHNPLNDIRQLRCAWYMQDLPVEVCREFAEWVMTNGCVDYGYPELTLQNYRDTYNSLLVDEVYIKQERDLDLTGGIVIQNSSFMLFVDYIFDKESEKGYNELTTNKGFNNLVEDIRIAHYKYTGSWLNVCLAKFQELLVVYEVRQQAKQLVTVASLEASPMVQQLIFM